MRTLLALAVLAAPLASAQPAAYSADFIHALLDVDDVSQLQVGTVPDALLPFFPPETELLGAYLGNFGTQALGHLDVVPDEARARYGAQVPDGWVLFEEPQDERQDTGFVTSRDSDATLRMTRGDQIAVIQFTTSLGGGTTVRVMSRTQLPGETEGQDVSENIRRLIPRLTSPDGGRQRASGGGGSSDYNVSDARLTSDLSLTEVLDHYGRQLVASGWTEAAALVRDDGAVSTWTARREGTWLTLTLRAEPADGGYDLRMAVLAPEN